MMYFKYMMKGQFATKEFCSLEELLPMMADTQDKKLPYAVYDCDNNKVFAWNCEYLKKETPTKYILKVQAANGTVSTTEWTDLTQLSLQIQKIGSRPWFVTKDGEKRVWRSGNLENKVNDAANKKEAPVVKKTAPVVPAQPEPDLDADYADIEAYISSLPPMPETFSDEEPVAENEPVEAEDSNEAVAEEEAQPAVEEPVTEETHEETVAEEKHEEPAVEEKHEEPVEQKSADEEMEDRIVMKLLNKFKEMGVFKV